MKIKTIYGVLLLAAVCAAPAAYALSLPEDNMKPYYTMDRIRSMSGWLVSDNPAGLIFNHASFSTADVRYGFGKGGLRNVTDGGTVNALGVGSESYRRWDQLSFYGRMSYDYAASRDRSWAGNAFIGDSPMLVGDSIPGNTRDETYAIEAGVAYRIGTARDHWVIGIKALYEDRSLAKRRDSRNKTTSMFLSVQPGVVFDSRVVSAGLNFTYKRTTEQVGYKAFGTNTTSGVIYFFEGLWFYTSQQLSGNETFNDIYYKGSEYGGSAQLEIKLGRSVKFFNQFSGEYGKMERYRFDLDQRLGDNDKLTYRYLGVLDFTGDRVDQRISVDASFGDLLKYNNIQELELDPVTSQKAYRQYGRFLKFKQRQRRLDADYKLYVKRDPWRSSWIIDASFNYYKTQSEYTISPARYNQQIRYSKAMLGVTKNIVFGHRDWLDVTVRGGYTFGGGTELDRVLPAGVQIDGENYRSDLLAQEYGFMTADRLNGEAGLRYTHTIPSRRIGFFVDLKGRAAWARSGALDGCRRGEVFAVVGLNF